MRIGIDLGGTKIEGIVIDNDSQIRASQGVPTPRDDYEAILGTITDLLSHLESEADRIVGQRVQGDNFSDLCDLLHNTAV
ncbi:MAG: ROK family protein [Proteobacteria bacterium]|nr:ROK family protein [Pseudomonadota bacterium]